MIQPVTAPVGRPLTTAVTGTNGKTTVATATLQLMRAAGLRAAGCDSTGIDDVHGAVRPAQFRRSAQFLPDLIAEQVALGAEAISLEAFVGILKDGLFEHVEVDVAVCTGLERDHLDVHGSLDQFGQTPGMEAEVLVGAALACGRERFVVAAEPVEQHGGGVPAEREQSALTASRSVGCGRGEDG